MDELAEAVTINVERFTYRRTDLTNATLDPEKLARCCPLDNRRRESTNVDVTLGVLDVLPLELLNTVLLKLDLRSLTTLRAVNRCARLTVDVIPQYKRIFTHSPRVLRAALSLGAASWISC